MRRIAILGLFFCSTLLSPLLLAWGSGDADEDLTTREGWESAYRELIGDSKRYVPENQHRDFQMFTKVYKHRQDSTTTEADYREIAKLQSRFDRLADAFDELPVDDQVVLPFYKGQNPSETRLSRIATPSEQYFYLCSYIAFDMSSEVFGIETPGALEPRLTREQRRELEAITAQLDVFIALLFLPQWAHLFGKMNEFLPNAYYGRVDDDAERVEKLSAAAMRANEDHFQVSLEGPFRENLREADEALEKMQRLHGSLGEGSLPDNRAALLDRLIGLLGTAYTEFKGHFEDEADLRDFMLGLDN